MRTEPAKEAHEPGAIAQASALRWEAEALRYREVHDRSPDGMMIFRSLRNAAGKIVDFEWLYSNASASRIVGRRAEDLLGKRLLVEMPGNAEAGLFDIYVGVVEQGEPHSHEFPYRHEGLDHWFRSTSIKLADGFYVAFTDLTLQKRAEEREARLAAIVRSSEHAIYSTTKAGVVETWNQGAEKLYGYTSAEIVGQSILVTIPDGRREERGQAVDRIWARGGVESFPTICLTKSGNPVHVSLTLSPVNDPHDRPSSVAVLARDISQEVELQERLVVADRMVSVVTLAAGMAHEINNPLACVLMNLEIASDELGLIQAKIPAVSWQELSSMLSEARGGAERIRRIMRDLMTYSHSDEERSGIIEVLPVLELSVTLAFSEIVDSARLVKAYAEIPSVFADGARLGQVFFNLLVNAAHAIGGGGPGANEIRIATSTDDSGRAVVEVSDTGPGIPKAILDRLFDPFFTTKPAGCGTGLGLSVCRNIVSAMGGEISAVNRAGGGTTFRVVLPPSKLAPRD